ncbi:MAG: hypothetical protein JNK46_20860, partial [Methylobacteriaceae bacterium]|nr:hypothetical protein [Methylobacteriaceae bacterium]
MSAFLSALSAVEWCALAVFLVVLVVFASSGARARRWRRLYVASLAVAAAGAALALAWSYRPSAWWPILRELAGEDARGAAAIVAALLLGPALGRRIRRLYGAPAAAALLALVALAPGPAPARAAETGAYR